MNNIKKDHVLLPFGKRSNINPIQSKEKKWRLIPPHSKKSREFYGLSPWKRKIIPKRVTTVGCNGPTKRNVTLEGNGERYNARLVTKVSHKEKKYLHDTS